MDYVCVLLCVGGYAYLCLYSVAHGIVKPLAKTGFLSNKIIEQPLAPERLLFKTQIMATQIRVMSYILLFCFAFFFLQEKNWKNIMNNRW